VWFTDASSRREKTWKDEYERKQGLPWDDRKQDYETRHSKAFKGRHGTECTDQQGEDGK
jgi:hypothetical protein